MSFDMKDLVSIIVPVYNAEKYLCKCIDSLINQTYSDLEIILVDDGSTDGSSAICDDYSMKDDRIIVLHKGNSGVSSSRNIGISIAKGEYICFLDADDKMSQNAIESFLRYHDYPLVISGYEEFGYKKGKKGPNSSREVIVKKDIPIIWNESQDPFWWFVWGKLYKMDVIKENSLSFNKNMIYLEDFCFILDYLYCIEKLYLISDSLIKHLVEETKYTKYRMPFDQLLMHMSIHDDCFKRLENVCGERFNKMREHISNRHFYNFDQYVKNTNSLFIKMRDCLRFGSAMKQDIFRDIKMKGRRKKLFWKSLYILSSFLPFVKHYSNK